MEFSDDEYDDAELPPLEDRFGTLSTAPPPRGSVPRGSGIVVKSDSAKQDIGALQAIDLEDITPSVGLKSPSAAIPMDRDHNAELEAKNKVIDSLKNQVQTLKSQIKRQNSKMSSGSRDSTDGHSSPCSSRVMSPTNFTQSAFPLSPTVQPSRPSSSLSTSSHQMLPSPVGSKRLNSSDRETSNSTDAEKLAGYSDSERIRGLVNEVEKLSEVNTSQEETILKLRTDLQDKMRDLKISLDIKEDMHKLHDELNRKCSLYEEQLQDNRNQIMQLQHQLDTDRGRFFQAEQENEELRKAQVSLKEKYKDIEARFEATNVEKEELQRDLALTKAEKLNPNICKCSMD